MDILEQLEVDINSIAKENIRKADSKDLPLINKSLISDLDDIFHDLYHNLVQEKNNKVSLNKGEGYKIVNLEDEANV